MRNNAGAWQATGRTQRTRNGRMALLALLAGVGLLAAGGGRALEQDEPTIAKDSIQITLVGSAAKRGFSIPGWRPYIEYRVNGPIASGSQLSAEFSLPTNKDWVKFDCETEETEAGRWWRTECGGDRVAGEKATVYTGPVNFSIRLRNELSGTNTTLFSGRFKVGLPPGAKPTDTSLFYVDEDWRVPIGYVYVAYDAGHRDNFLNVGFWYRGNPPDMSAHLFYQGKEIAKTSSAGNGALDWNPKKFQWGYAECSFLGVYPNEVPEDGYDPKFGLSSHPGEYEVKVLIVGHLARSIKFTAGADGIADNGIATANKLGSKRVIVPVQVIGNQGPWNQQAWKTDAFYGNPLTGFTAIPPAAAAAAGK